MLTSRTKRWLAAAATVVAVGGAGVLVPTAAHAATPVCASWSRWDNGPPYEIHTPTAGSGDQNRNCSLKQGNSGWGVVVLQEALRACFNQNISADGNFGPLTKNALKNAQRQLNSWSAAVFGIGSNLSVDGEYGPHTASWWWDAEYYQTGGLTYRGSFSCSMHLGEL